MTTDRLVHLLIALAFFSFFAKVTKPHVSAGNLLIGMLAAAIGSWVPDWDLLLGIGFHRSPITHSLLPSLIVAWIVLKGRLPRILMVGFMLGLSSHLLWDLVDYGNVQWIDGGNNDRMFLLINSILLLFFAFFVRHKVVDK